MAERRAKIGEQVHLTAQVTDAQEGDEVEFTVRAADGARVDALTAPVVDGGARAPWTVHLAGLPAPQELTFLADCLGSSVASSALTVEGGALQAVGGWALADGPAEEGVSFEGPGDPGLEDQGAWLAGGVVTQGTPLDFRVEVAAGDGPVTAPVSVTATLERDAGGGFAPVETFSGELTEGTALAIVLRWVADGVGEARVVVDWKQGEQAGPQVASPALDVVEAPPPPPPPAQPPAEVDTVAVQLHDGLLRPAAGTSYRLTLPDGSERSGRTDGDGFLREALPPGTALVVVRFTPAGALSEVALTVELTEADEADDAFVLAHLRNMGYADANDAKTALRFQAARGLALTGAVDEATRAAVQEILASNAPLQTQLGKSNG